MLYDEKFFARHADETLQSARIVVPHVLRKFCPKSVVDLGCALGAWLRVFGEHGARCIQGVDGFYVDRSKLLIPRENFTAVNLVEIVRGDIRPMLEKASGRYDLSVCLEVAEHLPGSSAADLVRTLTRLAPVVLFSAAVPGQGGVGHVNEQWPSYWKSLFQALGYRRVDAIRRRIWHDERVHWWYRQNIFLFVACDEILRFEALGREDPLPLSRTAYIHCANRLRGWRTGIVESPRVLSRAIRGLATRGARPRPRRDRPRSYVSENR